MTNIFYKILNLSLDASYIIILVLLLRLLLKKAPKKYSFLLWILVFVKLVVPFSFESDFTLIKAKDEIIRQDTLRKGIPVEVMPYTPSENLRQFEVERDTQTDNFVLDKRKINVNKAEETDYLPYIWLAGLFSFTAYSVLATLKFKSKLEDSKHLSGNIYISKNIKTAFVFGLIRPKIYLPLDLNENEKRYILKHEEIHIKRLDHISKFLAFAISSIHWFNPLVWLAYYFLGLDMELSCDERVIKEIGSDIKGDYSSSLLSFSTRKRILSASPIAFGESSTKTRIKNILSYKRPKLWISILAILILSLTLVACFAKSPEGKKENSKSENTELHSNYLQNKDLALNDEILNSVKSLIENEVIVLDGQGHKVLDYKIDSLKKLNEFKHLGENPLELWEVSYNLKFEDSENFLKSTDAKDLGGGWVESIDMKPFILFEKIEGAYRPLGNVAATDDKGYLYRNKMSQEMAIREFLDRLSNIWVSYNSEYKIVSFNNSSGSRIKLLLSRPIRDDERGIWVVERFIDTYGNLYLWPYNNEVELESYEYFKDLQEKVDKGEERWRLDPLEAAFDYIENVIMDTTVRKSQLVLEEESDLEYFYLIPESKYIGYYLEIFLDEKNGKSEDPQAPPVSKYPAIEIDNVELVQDRERFEEIGEKSETFEKFGYHIYNPATYPNIISLTENTKFYITDWANSQYDGTDKMKEVSAEEFAFYAKLQSRKFLIYVKSLKGEALEIGEIVLP